MKILLTGSNGLLGQKLVELLSTDDSIELLATGRGKKRFEGDVAYTSMDIENREEVFSVVRDFKPDAIINSAAMTNVDACELNQEECLNANVKAVENLVDASQSSDCFFLQVSTDFIFNGEEGPLDENAKPSPVNFYGETKLQAEQIVMEKCSHWAIARTVLVYGIVQDMSRSNIILWVKKSLETGKNIQVVDDQFRTPTLAEDLAQGCYLIVKDKTEGVFNISGKDFLTPYQMAMYTAEYFDLDSSLISKTDSSIFKQPARRPLKTGFKIDKAESMLGYRPHSFKEGIAIVDQQLKTINQT